MNWGLNLLLTFLNSLKNTKEALPLRTVPGHLKMQQIDLKRIPAASFHKRTFMLQLKVIVYGWNTGKE